MTQPSEWSGQTNVPPDLLAPQDPPPYPYAYPPGPYPGGYPPPPPPYGGDYPVAPRNGLGVASLVIAVLALLGSCTVAGGVIGGALAVVLGLVARGRVKRGEATNGGVALTGVILGALAVVAGLAFIAVWAGLFDQIGARDYFDCLQDAGQDSARVEQCSEAFRQSVEDRFTVTRAPGS